MQQHHVCLHRFAAIQQQWLDLIGKDVGTAMAKAVLYMGDGLYFNAMWESGPSGNPGNRREDVEELLAAVERLRG